VLLRNADELVEKSWITSSPVLCFYHESKMGIVWIGMPSLDIGGANFHFELNWKSGESGGFMFFRADMPSSSSWI